MTPIVRASRPKHSLGRLANGFGAAFFDEHEGHRLRGAGQGGEAAAERHVVEASVVEAGDDLESAPSASRQEVTSS
jgi:hypothetical protein